MAESRKLAAERETWRQLKSLADEIDRRLDALPNASAKRYWSYRLAPLVRQIRLDAWRAARGTGE